VTGLSQYAYIAAALLFCTGLKMLSRAETARRGNRLSAIAMLIAVIATLLYGGLNYGWIIAGVLVGGVIGIAVARMVKMTAMPEMVALFNGFGGIASLLVGWAEYHKGVSSGDEFGTLTTVAIYLAVLIGGVTFTGSLIAYGKLSEKLPGKPYLYGGQQIVNAIIALAIVGGGIIFCMNPTADVAYTLFIAAVIISLVFGVLAVIPIGGADMPVVIALLNSYSGLAACAAGFVILNNVLIVSGSLVGASGLVLTNIMCKAMNRSLANVLFSGFGSGTTASAGEAVTGEVNPISPEDAFLILESARSVAFVPGYGMAVAQAQHAVVELGNLLEENGCEIRYAIHPVAGRMPGHMNVLLAEANVPYEQLFEMDDVNPIISTIDVAVVIGANDVVNPAAREMESSPIYGMPIINVDEARTVFVLKRSMNPGFAGIDNPLFFKENTRMLFGDAKASVGALVAEFKDLD
jgi:NAD(P) transhydrogenase subunit beta